MQSFEDILKILKYCIEINKLKINKCLCKTVVKIFEDFDAFDSLYKIFQKVLSRSLRFLYCDEQTKDL